jgi:hypothetical protein
MVRGRAGVAGRGGGAPEGALLHHFQFSGAGGGAGGGVVECSVGEACLFSLHGREKQVRHKYVTRSRPRRLRPHGASAHGSGLTAPARSHVAHDRIDAGSPLSPP